MPDGTTETTTTDTTTSWTSSLPEPIRAHEAWKDVPDVGTLANRYLETRKPFAEQLPEDIRGEAMFKDIKDLAGLAKGYHGAQKLIGVPKDQLLRLPADDKPESWAPIYDKLGRPEKPEGYVLNGPDGKPIDPKQAESLYKAAHEAGVSQKQIEKLYGWLQETSGAAQTAQQAEAQRAAEAAVTELKTELGGAFDQRVERAKGAVKQLDADLKLGGKLAETLEKAGLANNPAVFKVFDHIAAQLAEDGKLAGKGGQQDNSLKSPAEARQHIAAKQQDKNFMARYLNKSAPGHAEAVAEMADLYKQSTAQAA